MSTLGDSSVPGQYPAVRVESGSSPGRVVLVSPLDNHAPPSARFGYLIFIHILSDSYLMIFSPQIEASAYQFIVSKLKIAYTFVAQRHLD